MKYSTTEGYPPLLDEKLQRDIDAARGVKPAQSALQRQEGGDHYKGRAIQPIEYIHANGLGFIEGSIVKYIARWRDKGGEGDLLKIKHYVDLLIELEGKKEINPAPVVDDGWIEWHGGENPLYNDLANVEVRFASGTVCKTVACNVRWFHVPPFERDYDHKLNVVAYRVV